MKHFFILILNVLNIPNIHAQVFKSFALGANLLSLHTDNKFVTFDERSLSSNYQLKDTLNDKYDIIQSKWLVNHSHDIKLALLINNHVDYPPTPGAFISKIVKDGNQYKIGESFIPYFSHNSPLSYCVYAYNRSLQGHWIPNDTLPAIFVPSDKKLTFAFDVTEDSTGLYLSVLSNNILSTWKYTPEQEYEVPDSTGTSAVFAIHWKLEHKLAGFPLQDFVVHKAKSDFIYCMYDGSVFKVNNQQKTVLGQLNITEKAYMQIGTNSAKIMSVANNAIGDTITYTW